MGELEPAYSFLTPFLSCPAYTLPYCLDKLTALLSQHCERASCARLFVFGSLTVVLQFCNFTERSETTDSLAWSRTYAVLSISRLYLSSLGFTTEQIHSLTDEDMQRIADILQAQRFDHESDEDVKFTARLVLAEKITPPQSHPDNQIAETEQ